MINKRKHDKMLVKWKRELKVTLQSTTSYVKRGQGLGAEGRKQGAGRVWKAELRF